MMKPISAAILNIRGAAPGTATIGNGATNLAKDIIRVANIAYNISQVEQKKKWFLVSNGRERLQQIGLPAYAGTTNIQSFFLGSTYILVFL